MENDLFFELPERKYEFRFDEKKQRELAELYRCDRKVEEAIVHSMVTSEDWRKMSVYKAAEWVLDELVSCALLRYVFEVALPEAGATVRREDVITSVDYYPGELVITVYVPDQKGGKVVPFPGRRKSPGS